MVGGATRNGIMFGTCEVILKYSGKYAESLTLNLPSLSMMLLTLTVLLRGRSEGGIFFDGAFPCSSCPWMLVLS